MLNAGPEARRALIEEAAGVLKHRRRKEKALRKLEAMQANLTRLVDLTGELGRRLKPLGRQAEIARRAAVIQADLRDARLRLLADDYVTLAAELAAGRADEAAAAALRAELEQRSRARQARKPSWTGRAAARAPAGRRPADLFALSGLAERLRGGAEPGRRAAPAPVRPARAAAARPGPDELDREAAALREQEAALSGQLAAARDQLAAAVSGRTEAEAALAALDRQLAAGRPGRGRSGRAAGPAARPGRGRPGHARRRPRTKAGRLAEALAQARTRAEHAQLQYGQLRTWPRAASRAGPSWPPRTSRPPRRWPRPAPGSPSSGRPSTRPAAPVRRCAPGPRR